MKSSLFFRQLNYSCSLSTSITSTLKGKRAVITGASRGIGAAIATRFAQEGAQCIIAGRNANLLDQVKEKMSNSTCNQCEHRIIVGDVGKTDFWKQVQKEDKIDILVNAAGITHFSLLFTTNIDFMKEVIQTNLMGTILGCRFVGKIMMAAKGGCIINVASLLGLKGGIGNTTYAASKAGLTRSVAAELGEKSIRVNVIVPGYIETDMTAAMTSENRSRALKNIPLKRFGLATEIADAAVFLACNMYANNCVLNLDGGLSAT